MRDRSADGGDTLVAHDLTLRLDEAEEALAAIRSGAVDALVVSTSDASPRVFLLKGADDAHRVLLETLNEGAMTVAPDSTILYGNRGLAELLGRPLEKVLGAPLVRFVDAGDAKLLAALLAPERANGKAEVTLIGVNGARTPVMVSARAVGDGETFTVVVTDLTPLKDAQTALRRANDELEERVLARTVEIARVNEVLRAEVQERTRLAEELRRKAELLVEADRRKDEFLSMLAHELRNPLSPILSAVELLRPFGRREPAIERYRTVIERQTHNLTRLVDDLLDVSRITRRAIALRRETTLLSAIVQHAVDATRPLVDASGHELTLVLPEAPVHIHVDPMRFEQVLVNLLNNAAKYTDRGGKISLTAASQGDTLEVRVKDTGVGIGPELLPHVFDLFVQGKRSLARSQGGLGIGLTLVKNLVEMHGGEVEARSEGAGRGTEIIVRLPLSIPERDSAPPPGDEMVSRAPPAPAGSRRSDVVKSPRRILVVEDNVDAAESLAELLQMWGFEVELAHDGEQALGILPRLSPHAALVDIGLPGMDGYELARRMRDSWPALESAVRSPRPGLADPPTLRAPGAELAESPAAPAPHLLLIGVSGYGQERDRREGAQAGFDHYLVKPLDADVLWQLLQESAYLAGA